MSHSAFSSRKEHSALTHEASFGSTSTCPFGMASPFSFGDASMCPFGVTSLCKHVSIRRNQPPSLQAHHRTSPSTTPSRTDSQATAGPPYAEPTSLPTNTGPPLPTGPASTTEWSSAEPDDCQSRLLQPGPTSSYMHPRPLPPTSLYK